jgi:hypothetical protein
VYTEDNRVTALVEDSAGDTARITFWRESMATGTHLGKYIKPMSMSHGITLMCV